MKKPARFFETARTFPKTRCFLQIRFHFVEIFIEDTQ